MEGHLRLAGEGYPVVSFGTGTLVRLPGPSLTQPNIYKFNEDSYATMYDELSGKDEKLYQANGILKMLDRNREVKSGPERWQDWHVGQPRLDNHKSDQGHVGVEAGVVDIVITCEERCWDAVVDDLLTREGPLDRPVHVFNVDIKDSHEEALVGGNAIVDLANSLNKAAIDERNTKGLQDWQNSGPARTGFDEKVPDILADWQERWPQFPALWTLAWF